MKIKNKRGQLAWNEIALWIIVLAVLALMIWFIYLARVKGFNIIDKFADFLRFGK